MRIEIKVLVTGFVALTWSALLTGCPGSLRDPERFVDGGTTDGGTCPDVPADIFTMKCAGSSCHSGKTPAQGLDLVSAGVAARVVGVAATECKGTLADPQDAEGSVLYTKVAPGATCGSRMPLGAPLSDSEIACVKDWIAAQTPSAATSSASGSGAGGSGGAGAGGAGGGTSTSTGM